ncbi:SIR2 family protein, partial [Tistrella mobilis]
MISIPVLARDVLEGAMTQEAGKPEALEKDWAYNYTRVESTFDPADIEQQGRLLLYRALNVGNLVALVGSGVSTSYGRVSWTDLCIDHLRVIQKIKLDSSGPHAERIKNRLTTILDHVEKREWRGGDLTFALEICEHFWLSLSDEDLTKAATAANLPLDMDARGRGARGRSLFRRMIMREVIDEHRFIEKLLDQAGLREFRGSPQHPSVLDGILGEAAPLSRTASERRNRNYVKIFGRESANKLNKICQKHKNDISKTTELSSKLTELLLGMSPGEIPVSGYFIVSLLYSSLLQDKNKLSILNICNEFEEIWKNSGDSTWRSRSSMVPLALDQLHMMAFDLEVKRFATLNWDLEIERFFQDLGFQIPEGSYLATGEDSVERIGPLGGRARDMTLPPAQVTNLIDFGFDAEDYNLQVIHLHGRATQDDDLVITSTDYQRAYAGDHQRNMLFRQGLDVTFGGNPVLFAGIGMEEADVLRPFREFVARRPYKSRPVIVIRDSKSSISAREAFAIKSFVEYGIYLIHYGEFPEDEEDLVSKLVKNESLLYLVDSLLIFLRTIRFGDEEERSNLYIMNRGSEDFERHLEIWKKLNSSYSSEYITKKENISKEIYNYFISIIEIIYRFIEFLKLISNEEFSEQRANHIQHYINTFCNGIMGLAEHISIVVLLHQVKRGWGDWKRGWRELPADRYTAVRFHQEKGSSGNKPDRISFGRHRVDIQVSLANTFDKNELWRGMKMSMRRPWLDRPRRVFIISATRGMGRGYLFCLLSRMALHNDSPYPVSFFVNLNFSSEIASVLDGLIDFIAFAEEYAAHGWGCRNCSTGSPLDGDLWHNMPRLSRLESAIQLRRKKKKRVLISINAFDVLWHPAGYPKTSEPVRKVIESGESVVILCRARG